MTSIMVFDRARIKQPTPAERLILSPTSPLARGLVFAGVPGLSDPVSGTMPRPIDNTNSKLGSYAGNRTFRSESVSSGGWFWQLPARSPFYGIDTRCTMLVRANIETRSSWMVMIGCGYAAPGWASPYHVLSFGAHSTNDYGFFSVAIDASTNFGVAGDSTYYPSGKTFAVTRDANSVRFYRDGETFGTAKSLGTSAAPAFTNRVAVRMMNRSDDSPSEGYIGDCAVGLVWNRVLSSRELRDAHLNPWQVFA